MSWRCKNCETLNPPDLERCEVCDRPRPRPSEVPPSPAPAHTPRAGARTRPYVPDGARMVEAPGPRRDARLAPPPPDASLDAASAPEVQVLRTAGRGARTGARAGAWLAFILLAVAVAVLAASNVAPLSTLAPWAALGLIVLVPLGALLGWIVGALLGFLAGLA